MILSWLSLSTIYCWFLSPHLHDYLGLWFLLSPPLPLKNKNPQKNTKYLPFFLHTYSLHLIWLAFLHFISISITIYNQFFSILLHMCGLPPLGHVYVCYVLFLFPRKSCFPLVWWIAGSLTLLLFTGHCNGLPVGNSNNMPSEYCWILLLARYPVEVLLLAG